VSKFKVGDRVRSENTGYGGMSKMTEGIVVGTPSYGDGLYEVKVISGIFRDELSKETLTNASSWSFTESELEPLFKVGDEVRVKKGFECENCRNKIGVVIATDKNVYPIEVKYNSGEKEVFKIEALELIKGGSTMCEKSLRDRIEALTGNSTLKETDDLIREIQDGISRGIYNDGRTIEINSWSNCWIEGDKNGEFKVRIQVEDYIKLFPFTTQCSKLRAFKDALLWLLDKSGIEKKDKEKQALKEELAELKDKVKSIEAKIERVI